MLWATMLQNNLPYMVCTFTSCSIRFPNSRPFTAFLIFSHPAHAGSLSPQAQTVVLRLQPPQLFDRVLPSLIPPLLALRLLSVRTIVRHHTRLPAFCFSLILI